MTTRFLIRPRPRRRARAFNRSPAFSNWATRSTSLIMESPLVRAASLNGVICLIVVLLSGCAGEEPHQRAPQPDTAFQLQILKKELASLKEAQAATEKELRGIESLLRGRALSRSPGSSNTIFNIDGAAAIRGESTAKLVLIEFSDYQCPFCQGYFRETYPQIKRDYVDKGIIRYVLCDFPLSTIHKSAVKAAEAAHCAGEQGKYWEMRSLLMQGQSQLDVSSLMRTAQQVGLDSAQFQQCVDDAGYEKKIAQQIRQASEHGIRGTPAFMLGFAEPDGKTVRIDRTITGSPSYDVFKQEIEELFTRVR